jgi:hypothetical protein
MDGWRRMGLDDVSQLGKRCQLGLHSSFWAPLGVVLDGVRLITLIQTYPALFAAIGGQDGMDAGGAHRMTCSIYRTCRQS